MKISFLTFALCIAVTAYGQITNAYTEYVKQAEAAYEAKQYKQSADAYSKAFAANGSKAMMDDRYNAACSWAMAGNADSAFFQLDRIATKSGYANLGHLTVDTDLKGLHNDKRWIAVCSKVRENKEKAEAGLDKPLVAMLDSILRDDQEGRIQIEPIQKKYGWDSKEMKALVKDLTAKDSINLIKICKILDTRGWLGPDVIGAQGNQTLFLVIQHANINIQKKYLPMMQDAVKKGKAQPSSLALLEDRVALREGRKQIYGSQIGMNGNEYYLSPLEDPDNVDKRRASVGLGPLAEYLQHWNLKWDVEAYKKQLPEIEKIDKVMQSKDN